MRRALPRALLAVALAATPPAASAADPGADYGDTPAELRPYAAWSVKPYRRFFDSKLEFRGAGREEPEPAGLDRVRLGFFTPLDGKSDDDAAGRRMRRGVELALEEANAAGGYKGVPYELVVKNDQLTWGASTKVVVDLAYRDKVWAVIGSIDSDSTHLATRIALKAEIPVVNVGSTDPTVTEHRVPWVFRTTPDDRQTGYRLARLLFEEKKLRRVAVLRSGDRYGRMGVVEFRDAARRLRHPLPLDIQFRTQTEDFSSQLDRVAASDVEALVLWTKATHAAKIVRQLRARGMKMPVFGTDRVGETAFLELAGPAAEGVVVTRWLDPERADPRWSRFKDAYRKADGSDPDAFAAYGYDAARLLIEAIARTGLNRVRIRDELAKLKHYRGAGGAMIFDLNGNNMAPVSLAKVEGGRFVSY